MSCKVIGSTSLAAVGVYALNQSRAHQPGSLIGKRIMAGVGIGKSIEALFIYELLMECL